MTSLPGMDDRALVARQLGREPRAFRRVVVRCPFGRPAVTEQDPYGGDGEPFPTTYWLTCPHLVASVSRLEAAGGVERWTAAVAEDPALADGLRRADEEQREIRRVRRGPDGDGTAGRRSSSGSAARPGAGSLKCLHAHVAYALAQPDYLLGARILADVDDPWPAHACCTEP